MSRKWKQQIAMFVFAMMAMTIFAMESPSEGTELKMNQTDDQTHDSDIAFFSDQEIDEIEEAQIRKTEKKRTSRQQLLNRRKTAAWEDGDFDVNDFEASGSNYESDFEDFNGNHQPKKEHSGERMQLLVNWNTFNAEKLIFKKKRENTHVKANKAKNAKHFADFLESEDLLKYTLLDKRHKNFMECLPVTLSHDTGYVYWNSNVRTVDRVDLEPEVRDFQIEMLNFVNDVFSRIPYTDSPTDYDFSFDTTVDHKKWFMLALHKQKNTIIGIQWEYVSENDIQTSECIPVMLSDGYGCVYWNTNARTVERVRVGAEIKDFQTEMLNFVKDVFSRIPDSDSPTDYAFSFDTTADYKKWFMLALHKQKNAIIGRQWEYVSANNFQTSNFEPCDVDWRWSTKNQIGQIFHWIKLPSKISDGLMILTDGICKSLLANGFNFPPDRRNKKRKICENDIQCALNEKLDKTAKFLLLSTVNDRNEKRYIVKDEDINKAFRENLCDSFTFMMNSRNWPENLWRHVLESEHEQSKEMVRVLLERIKDSPKENHFNDLLKTFDKLMHLAGHRSTSGHLNWSLKIFCKSVQKQVYQRLLFFGVVKQDLEQCKFAINNGASLQERTSSGDAIAMANKFCWCEKKDLLYTSFIRNEYCLHLWLLDDMTALEIATLLARGELHGGYHKNRQTIKLYLSNAKDLEDYSKNNKRKRIFYNVL